MSAEFINITKDNLAGEHICCGFSDKKCMKGYELKKAWLEEEICKGYVFRKLNERAKVFLEYGDAENAWLPIEAPNYIALGCFWVSGQYKGKGYAKQLLHDAYLDAKSRGKEGLVAIVGTKKFHFMSDTKWLLKQGFVEVDKLTNGFSLLVKKINEKAPDPSFNLNVRSGECPEKNGLVVYYSNRCPFTEYYVKEVLPETAKNRNLPLTLIKLEDKKQAQEAPTPATIFSMFLNGKFVTTDISSCLDSRFDKIISK